MSGSWPVAEVEERDWHPSERVLATLDVFERFRVERPYRAAVLPSIAHETPAVDAATSALIEHATDDITRFDEQMSAMPTPMPLILLRTESASSSQIENLSTSSRQLAFAGLGVSDRANAAVVAANVRAMQAALDISGPVNADLILSIHRVLLEESEPDIAGRWRSQQVWVGGSSASPHGATYVAPHEDRVADAIADLVEFGGRDDMPALVQAAVLHAQFENIHPFEDGNGRTGRVLVHTVLSQRGLVRHSTVPVSAGLLRDTRAYFSALEAYREGDLAPILAQVATASRAATTNGRELAADIHQIRDQWMERIKARTDSAAWRLADELFAQPVVNAPWVAEKLGVSERTARSALDTLASAEVITQTTAARRNRVWQAGEVLEAMDAFARRATRRSAS